jgi:hypothetical protein
VLRRKNGHEMLLSANQPLRWLRAPRMGSGSECPKALPDASMVGTMRFIEPKVDQYLFFNNRPLGAFVHRRSLAAIQKSSAASS